MNDMRLINANRAISRVDEIPFLTDKNQAFFEGCRYMKKRVLKVLRTSKTIDAVEVVRCKNCKYAEEIGEFGCYCRKEDAPWFNDMFEVYMNFDDFCSYGERKEADG